MPKTPVSLKTVDNSKKVIDGLSKLIQQRVYVGISESSTEARKQQLLKMAISKKSSKKKARIAAAANEEVTNAGLLFIHSKGSPLHHIPARPVLEPAIADPENKERIAAEIQAAGQAALEGKDPTPFLKRAGIAGQNAARQWFTNPKNNWPPNSPRTIKAKGSDRPLIDTGAMRQAISYFVKDGDK